MCLSSEQVRACISFTSIPEHHEAGLFEHYVVVGGVDFFLSNGGFLPLRGFFSPVGFYRGSVSLPLPQNVVLCFASVCVHLLCVSLVVPRPRMVIIIQVELQSCTDDVAPMSVNGSLD